MSKKIIYYILNIVTVITVTMFFSCNDSFKQVQRLGISENEPIGVAENINLKYTDSGRVTANLLGSKMLDYSNRDFSFNEFVNGITLYIYDDKKNKSTVVSDYAIVYNKTNLIDLQGNVVITTHDNNVLKTEQLYYDTKREWIFSNYPIKIETNDGALLKGNIFDTNKEFRNVTLLEFHDSNLIMKE